MGNRFLGVQISILWVVFAVKTVTLLWQPAKAQDIASECHSSAAETNFIPVRITKGPQLITETNIPLLIPEWWRLCTDIRTAMLVCVATSLLMYNRAKECMKSTAVAAGRNSGPTE